MQLSLKNVVTLALLGLGNVIPCTSGAPTDLSQPLDVPLPDVPHDDIGFFPRALLPRKGGKGGGGGGGDGSSSGGSGGGTNPGGFGGGGNSGGGDNGPNPGGFGGGGRPGGGGGSGPNPGGFGGGNSGDDSGVVDILTGNYRVEKSTSGDEDTYRVFAKDPNSPGDQNLEVPIGDLRVNRQDKSITADDVRNEDDRNPDRARLWEVEMSLFVHQSGMKPQDLRSVHADSIENEATSQAIDRAREKKGGEESFSISPTEDKEIFDDIMQNTPFGRSTQNILDNTPVGKQVERIDVSPGLGEDDSNLGFYLA